MLLPIGEPISVPVELLCPTENPPLKSGGRLVRFDVDACCVELDEGGRTPNVEARTVLSILGQRPARLLAIVEETVGRQVRLRVRRVARCDKREYPREFGGVELRYRQLRPDEGAELVERWLEGANVDAPGAEWRTPIPFMNFSGSGVRFCDSAPCAPEDRLLLELRVPTCTRAFRCSGRVVRTEPSPEGTSIAVHFVALSADAVSALTRYTVERQVAALDGSDA